MSAQMKSMTPKERIIRQIEHKETDFIPFSRLDFEGDVAERLDDYYGTRDWRLTVAKYNHIKGITGANRDGNAARREGHYTYDVFGTKWRDDLRPFHLEEPGLKQPDLQHYRFPKASEFLPVNWQKQAIADSGDKENYFLIAGFGFGLFERTWAVRGFSNALMDCIAEPAFYQKLIERVAELQLDIIDHLVKLPIDGVWFSDDWGDQRGVLIGPDRWRQYIKPHLAEMYQRAHKAGKYTFNHCCGNIKEIIPDLIEIGLDVLQSVQPEAMDPYELKNEFGRDITFWGGLGSQQIIPFGSPGEIKKEIRNLCQYMGKKGGYILGPAKSLQPETPTANAAAVVEGFLAEAGEALD